LIGSVVIEQVELDQLNALIFEIEQRARHSAKRWALRRNKTGRQRRHVSGTPILRPINPRSQPELKSFLAPATQSRGFGYLALKTLIAGVGDLAEAA
jgi:hypothetical protein